MWARIYLDDPACTVRRSHLTTAWGPPAAPAADAKQRRPGARNCRNITTTIECGVLLPNAEHAIIERVKLKDYVLSFSHPVGRFKARFFAGLDFSADRWDVLEQALRTQHLSQDAEAGVPDAFGQPFTIRAILRGPAGQSALVVSVWFIRAGEAQPRFVTAYPGETK